MSATSNISGARPHSLRGAFDTYVPSRIVDSFYRVFVGTFLVYFAWLFAHSTDWLSAAGFHFSRYHIHVLPLSAANIAILGAIAFAACGTALALPRSRLVTIILVLVALFMDLADNAVAFTLTKLFVLTFLFLLFRPRVAFTTHSGVSYEPVWHTRLLQLMILLLYLSSGVCKISRGDWLRDPMVLAKQLQIGYETSASRLILHEMPAEVWAFFAWTTLVFEVMAPVIFIWPRTRLGAIAFGILFHLSLAILMQQLVFFSLVMLSYYLLLAVSWTDREETHPDAPITASPSGRASPSGQEALGRI